MNVKNLSDLDIRRAVVFYALQKFFPIEQCMEAIQVLDDRFPVANTFPVLAYIDEIRDIVNVGDNRVKLSVALTKGLYSSIAPENTNLWDAMQASNGGTLPGFPLSDLPQAGFVDPVQKTNVYDVNDVNDVSGVNDVSDVSDVSGVNDVSDFSDVSDVSGVSGVSGVNDVNDVNDFNDVNDVNDTRNKMCVFSFMLNILFCGIEKEGNNKEKKMCDHLLARVLDLNLGRDHASKLHLWCKSLGTQTIGNINDESDMIKIIHEIYLWCCEYLGPIQADKLFASTVHETEAIPEANDYSPRNFFG